MKLIAYTCRFVINVLLIAFFWFGLVVTLLQLQSILIPDEVILAGNTKLGEALIYVLTLIPSIPLGLVLGNVISHLATRLRIYGWNEAGSTQLNFRLNQYLLLKLSLLMFFCTFPFSVIGSLNHYYVKHDGIYYRPIFWAKMKHYDFCEVKRIVVVCDVSRKGSLKLGYNFIFYDDVELNLINGFKKNKSDFISKLPIIKGLISPCNITKSWRISQKGMKLFYQIYGEDEFNHFFMESGHRSQVSQPI